MTTLLIVDDEPSARETLLSMLEGSPYDIETAKNGIEALQKAERLQPDLVLLDVMMPGMDGFEVCRRFRSTPRLAEVPIVILTALDDRTSLLRGIEAGADDFLSKPVDRAELRARVRTITRLNRYRTLMEQRENLRLLAERLMTAQEEERRRISRELHDDLGQALTSLMLDIRALQENLPAADAALTERLQALYRQTQEISVRVRALAQDMRPPVLDTLGLKEALQAYCAEFGRRTGLQVQFEADDLPPAIPDVHAVTFYRVLQEALTNVVKHAQASRVWVDLTLEGRTITLTVQDNGCGFDTEKPHPGGLGLAGLRERLILAGGIFKVSSSPVRGTILMARLSLPEKAVEAEA
ncbi:MAG: response regulator [Chloroflexota bacterium]